MYVPRAWQTKGPDEIRRNGTRLHRIGKRFRTKGVLQFRQERALPRKQAIRDRMGQSEGTKILF